MYRALMFLHIFGTPTLPNVVLIVMAGLVIKVKWRTVGPDTATVMFLNTAPKSIRKSPTTAIVPVFSL